SFFAAFGGLIGLLYLSLQGLESHQLNQRIGLIGSVVILSVISLFMLAAVIRQVNVYESFVDGAKEGFSVAVQIIPYLVAMLVAISVFRNSGCMDYIVHGIGSIVRELGWDDRFVAALPVGLMKVLSGSGARGLMVDVMKTYGVDSFEGQLAAIIQGSTETTFYVLAVYFGSVNIRKTRHALACALWADLIGLIAAILIAYAFFGHSL
ncbi:MAG: spore maturation protein, partial [Betaproteobacteria bacterium]|nr:spore maturation protein [Betaproteobacteria bacterium]